MEDNIQNRINALGFISINNIEEVNLIENGLLHIHAEWSGQSLLRTKQVFQLLENLQLANSVKLYFLDNDLIVNNKHIKLLNNHGYGETLIFENSQIIYSSRFGKPIEELIIYINKLKE